MPTFVGRSPILPPVINGALVGLFEPTLHPGFPEGGTEREDLDYERLEGLDHLDSFFEARGHEHAVDLIRRAWESHQGIALYLRNFDLGGRLMDADEMKVWGHLAPADRDPSLWIGTNMSTDDTRFQKVLVENFSPTMPLIGIENPVADSTWVVNLPKLQFVDESWKKAASELIAAASIIFVYYSGSSPGIDTELNLIRQQQRQQATVVAWESPPEDFLVSRQMTEPDISKLKDFPYVLHWNDDDESLKKLLRIVAERPPQKSFLRFSPEPPSPAKPQPPPDVRKETDDCTNLLYVNALDWIKEGKDLAAEDALIGALALTYWSTVSMARAEVLHALVFVQMHQRKKPHFISNLVRWLRTLEYLISSGQLSAGLPIQDLDFIASSMKSFLSEEEARLLVVRIDKLKSEAQGLST